MADAQHSPRWAFVVQRQTCATPTMPNLHRLIQVKQVLGGLNVPLALSVFHGAFSTPALSRTRSTFGPRAWTAIDGFILPASDLVWSRLRQDLAEGTERVGWTARLLRNGSRSLKTKQTGCPVWRGVLLSRLTQRTRK